MKNITLKELQDLVEDSTKLLKYVVKIDSGQDIEKINKACEDIMGSLRKVIIANELQERQIICISGLQGAGKTTLMQKFYDIPENILNISMGQGERIPIIIHESKECKKSIEMYTRELVKENNEYSVRRREVESDEFIEASKGSNSINRNITTMYLELSLPYKYIKNEITAFMLLPGFEKKHDYWRNLIDFSIKCSDAAVFVFNESSFSRADNAVILDEIKKKFENNLIYVISRADQSPDDNKEVKNTCIETMKIPSAEKDRVVCTGIYPEDEKNEKWRKQFMDAIDRYCRPPLDFQGKCSEYIYKEMEKIINKIDEIQTCVVVDKEIQLKKENSGILEAFDKKTEKGKKMFKKNIEDAVLMAENDSLKKIEQYFKETTTKGTLKGIKRAIFGESAKDIIELKNVVLDSLNDDSGKPYIYRSLIKSADNVIGSLQDNNTIKKHILTDGTQDNISDEEARNTQLYEAKNEYVMDIAHFIDGNNNDELKSSMEELAQGLADMTAYYYTQNMIYCVNPECGKGIELEKSHLTLDQIVKSAKDTKLFGASILGLVAADVVKDGELNGIAAIGKALNIPSGVLFAGTGALLALGAGTAITRDLNRMHCMDYGMACNTVYAIYKNIASQIVNSYNDYVEFVRDNLERSLIKKTKINASIDAGYNMQMALNRIRASVEKTRDAARNDKYDLKRAFE